MWSFLLVSALVAQAPSSENKTAAFVIAKRGSPADLLNAVSQATQHAASAVLKDALVPESAIRAKLGDHPERRVEHCGANLKCIAKQGEMVGAAKVLYARLVKRSGRKPIQVQLLVIGVKSRLIEQRALVELRSVEEVQATLVDQIYAMLSVNGPGYLEISGVSTEVTIDGQVVGKGPGTYTVHPGHHQVTAGGATSSILVLPGSVEHLKLSPQGSEPPRLAP